MLVLNNGYVGFFRSTLLKLTRNKYKLPAAALAAVLVVISGCVDPSASDPILGACPKGSSGAASVQLERGALQSETPHTRFIVKSSPVVKSSMKSTSAAIEERLSADPSAAAKVEPLNSDFYRMEFGRELNSREVADLLDSSEYEYIEPDYEVYPVLISNDTDLAGQWAHATVHSAEAWDISRGSKSVVVGVLDSGVDVSHPDLAANILG